MTESNIYMDAKIRIKLRRPDMSVYLCKQCRVLPVHNTSVHMPRTVIVGHTLRNLKKFNESPTSSQFTQPVTCLNKQNCNFCRLSSLLFLFCANKISKILILGLLTYTDVIVLYFLITFIVFSNILRPEIAKIVRLSASSSERQLSFPIYYQ